MRWENIIGQDLLKKQLQDSIEENRISHAQIFVGNSGYGLLPLALAYAAEILAKDSKDSYKQVEKLQHPDLHFSFPTINNATEKLEAVSSDYIQQFRNFVLDNPYQDLNHWYTYLDEDKKQGIISVKEIETIIEKLSLKSFEGGFKVQIVWFAETMRTEAANKLLKILEEPPAKTLFLLLAEDEKKILPTILSRCQKIDVHRILEDSVVEALVSNHSLSKEQAIKIALRADGDWNQVSSLIHSDLVREEFEKYFILLNRAAFMAPRKPQYLRDIVDWSLKVSSWGREKQKNFLQFCAETFRQALLENYQTQELVHNPLTYENFKWLSFSSFVHSKNIEDILKEINDAYFHIERNGNAKIIFLDMGVKLTRFLARKE